MLARCRSPTVHILAGLSTACATILGGSDVIRRRMDVACVSRTRMFQVLTQEILGKDEPLAGDLNRQCNTESTQRTEASSSSPHESLASTWGIC